MNQYVDISYITALRRELHQYPEIGYDLPRTTAIIKAELKKIGVAYTDEYCPCSLVGVINPDGDGPMVALRADMDALPVTEKTNLPFKSRIDGQMHACGHDAHAAILLGVVKYLHTIRDTLPCRVKFIFQPNEEGADSAAMHLIKKGALDDVDMILGLHAENRLDSGTIGICPGSFMASCRNFTVEFFGKTAHATQPHNGADTLTAAVELYNQLQTVLTRQISPLQNVVCGINSFHAGSAHNVIPDYAVLKGTLRAYDMDTESYIFRRINEIAVHASENTGCTCKVSTTELLPPVYNDEHLTELVRLAAEKVVGSENVLQINPYMSSEDFADYLTKVPGIFFRIGTGNPDNPIRTTAHNNDFYIEDEKALAIGGNILVQFILNMENNN